MLFQQRDPRPTCCVSARDCSDLNYQPELTRWMISWGCILYCPFCGASLVGMVGKPKVELDIPLAEQGYLLGVGSVE